MDLLSNGLCTDVIIGPAQFKTIYSLDNRNKYMDKFLQLISVLFVIFVLALGAESPCTISLNHSDCSKSSSENNREYSSEDVTGRIAQSFTIKNTHQIRISKQSARRLFQNNQNLSDKNDLIFRDNNPLPNISLVALSSTVLRL